MQPIVARRFWTNEVVLVLAFLDNGEAVVVESGGHMAMEDIPNLVVLYGNMDFPIGYEFYEAKAVEAAS